jgi:hypothetical protein
VNDSRAKGLATYYVPMHCHVMFHVRGGKGLSSTMGCRAAGLPGRKRAEVIVNKKSRLAKGESLLKLVESRVHCVISLVWTTGEEERKKKKK